ncbi:permease [Paracoccus aestuarii]|uniref:Permease n=1 Tax=Paracoccus aestuarii TaxID=453842 RepID=A0A418ZYM4_9RHOB|nr:permease [Paracoccus aestuarii]RJL05621.1 permease [Paracoccus aestuarii]WCQ97931.1 permease [Paracoccus aestuarii]
MNDMEWGGVGETEGPFMAGASPPGAGLRIPDMAEGEDEIDVLRWLFWDYVKDLRGHQAELETIKAREIDPAKLKKAMETAKTVREAVQLLMAERSKVDKLRKDIAGGVGGGALDLDAARDEIGRRLACLRRAGGG